MESYDLENKNSGYKLNSEIGDFILKSLELWGFRKIMEDQII